MIAREIIELHAHEVTDKAGRDLSRFPVAGMENGIVSGVHEIYPCGPEGYLALLIGTPE